MDIALVSQALAVIHDAASSANTRQEAQQYLDQFRGRQDAAAVGCALAGPQNDGTVRHFGLQLLHHALAQHLAQMQRADVAHIRSVLLELARDTGAPHYIREKVAALVVYLCKQTWGTQADPWRDFDTQLVALWAGGARLFVLSVLRTLFEDVYLLDDPVALRRGPNFSVLCSSILLTRDDAEEIHGAEFTEFRGSDDGWLGRIVSAVSGEDGAGGASGPSGNTSASGSNSSTTLASLEALKSIVPWIPARPAVSANLTPLLLSTLKNASPDVRVLACDCLHILLTRKLEKPEFDAVVGRFMSPEGLAWIKEVHDSVKVDASDIDDIEYVFLKKLVEMTVSVGEYIEHPKRQRPIAGADYNAFFALLLQFARHPSLLVSGLSLQFWCSLLRLEVAPSQREEVLPQLLQIASERVIHYDNTSEDSDARLFMEFDFSSQPESRAFYADFRRYMMDIIRLTVCLSPAAALNFLHEHVSSFFNSDMGREALNKHLKLTDAPHIFARSMMDIVESAVRGVSRRQLCFSIAADDQVMQMCEQWALEMMSLRFVDTTLHRKLVECLVQFAPLFTKQNSNDNVLFKILERVLEACTFGDLSEAAAASNRSNGDSPEDLQQAIIDLRASSGTELNRLAFMIPEALMGIYDQLESVIGQLLVNAQVREQESVLFKSFLLVVSQRSSLPDKTTPFERIVDPVLSSWTHEGTVKGLSDLEWFMERVGIVAIAQYFQTRGIKPETNLLATPMDDEGRALKAELAKKWQAIFPIRPTRIFIQYPIEKLDHASPEYLHLLQMWKPRVQQFLPHILQLVAQIVAYHNPENWAPLPPEVQTFVKTSCTERFWQVGVSMQSKDEFERDNAEASKTLRDFADSVGHIIRYTREYAFLTLGSISQLEETMYEMDGMGTLLFQALAGGNTVGITSHCWRHIISIVVRNVIKNCPPDYYSSFLSPFVSQFLDKIQSVLLEKWAVLAQTGYQLMDEEMMEQFDQEDQTLSDEMMSEHLLRQLTAMCVRLLIDLAKHDKSKRGPLNGLRAWVLEDEKVLMAVLRTCNSILSFKDSRCCFNICLLLRELLYNKGGALRKWPSAAEYLGQEIVPALLIVFFDEYFHESAIEACNILTYLWEEYGQLLYEPLGRLGTSRNGQSIEDLYAEMSARRFSEQRRAILMEFLNGFKDKEEDGSRAKLLKKVQQRVSSREKPGFDETYDAAATINLFSMD